MQEWPAKTLLRFASCWRTNSRFPGGLRTLLDGESEFEVVAEAGDLEGALAGAEPAAGRVVLDLNLPGAASVDAILRIRGAVARHPHRGAGDPARGGVSGRALAAGALGCVLREAAAEELVEAVRAAAGDTYLNPRLDAELAAEPPAGDPGELSNRELEVLRLIALGHTNTEVAERLLVSIRTVETDRSHVQQKLGLSSRSELVAYALERGLVAR